MALNIKNAEVERLAAELAALTGATKTETIRVALQLQKERLQVELAKQPRGQRLREWLENEFWPTLPEGAMRPMTKEEEDAILGYGPNGYCE